MNTTDDGRALITNVIIEVRVVDGGLYLYFRNIDPTRSGITIESCQILGVGTGYEEASDQLGAYIRCQLSPLDMESTDVFTVVREAEDSMHTVLRRAD